MKAKWLRTGPVPSGVGNSLGDRRNPWRRTRTAAKASPTQLLSAISNNAALCETHWRIRMDEVSVHDRRI